MMKMSLKHENRKSRNAICPNTISTNLEGCELERALWLEYSFFIEPTL